MAKELVFPESTLQVKPWPDPVLDQMGHDARSQYVERYWLPIVGPSCLLLLRRLAAELEASPNGFPIDTVQWAFQLGLGVKGGRHGPFWRALDRGCRFGATSRNGSLLVVRRRIAPLSALSARQAARLPRSLQDALRADQASGSAGAQVAD